MAVVRLTYKLTSGQANIIDLARGISLTERRMIHQKQVFTILGGMIVDDAINTKVKLSTAPNNFYTRNAVSRGFRAWKAMRAKTLENSASGTVPKYSDFKVLLDATSATTYLNPFSAGSVELTDGEWNYADLTSESAPGANKQLMIVGDSHTSSKYSLAKGWLETRPKPHQLNPEYQDLNSNGIEDVAEDFLNTLNQDSTEGTERMNEIVNENDQHPFPRSELMTTQSTYSATEPRNLQLQFIHHAAANEVSTSVPGFQALCGLIRADVQGGSDPILVIDVETKGWNF